jgi:predicted permease
MVALVSAGLFVRGLQQAGTVDPGYAEPDRLLIVTTDLRLAGTLDSASSTTVLARVLERLTALPGVTRVAASHFVPLGFGGNSSSGIRVEGYQPAADENMSVQYSVVTAGYFETVGMPLTRGRALEETDRGDTAPVAVVNEAFVRRFLAGQDPVGQRFRQGGREVEIVGVAHDAKYARLEEAAFPMIYRPFTQRYRPDLHLHLRTAGDPAAAVEAIRREMAAVAPDLPFLDPRTLTQQMVPATLVQRIGARVLGLFGMMALLLSAIGIYGVVAYSVAQRTRELGVRVALGASTPSVVRLVVGQGLRITAVGLTIGALLALGVGQLLKSQLFGLNPADPLTFGVLIALLGGVALLASLLTARRAARVDPVVALRGE